jgi:hypothetical protein
MLLLEAYISLGSSRHIAPGWKFGGGRKTALLAPKKDKKNRFSPGKCRKKRVFLAPREEQHRGLKNHPQTMAGHLNRGPREERI